jgi:hypothetical protein
MQSAIITTLHVPQGPETYRVRTSDRPRPLTLPVIPVYQHGMIIPTLACQPTTVRRLVIPRRCVAARQRDDGVNGEDSGGYLDELISTVSVTVMHESGKD